MSGGPPFTTHNYRVRTKSSRTYVSQQNGSCKGPIWAGLEQGLGEHMQQSPRIAAIMPMQQRKQKHEFEDVLFRGGKNSM